MNKASDNLWLNAVIQQQESAAKLLGDPSDPLVNFSKKKQKEARKQFSATLSASVDVSTLLSSGQTSTKSDDISASSASSENIFLVSHLMKDSDSDKKDKDNKKKRKKDKEKKKLRKEASNTLTDHLLDANSKTGPIMAEVLKYSSNMVLCGEDLWLYDDELGCYRPGTYNEVARELRSLLPYEEQLKISSREYKECFEQLKLSDEILHPNGFFENQPFVNCENGVVDILRGVLLDHTPEFFFKHCIRARYLPGSKCPKFMEYVEHITDGDKELKQLLRVILGYLCSHYNNAKLAVFIYGIPHTGKSVFLNVIERIIGEEYVAHTDLAMLQRQEYVANLSGKLINVAPDLKNESLKDVGFFKSLVSHDDKVDARVLYGNPQKVKGETKMVFSSNHLLSFDASLGVYDIEATFNRLLFFPYQNKPISREQENKHLSDEIYAEKDAIFTWAMKGLKDYVENNESFPECRLSTELKEKNMAAYCPEKIFVSKCIKHVENAFESSSSIREAFENFCHEVGIKSKPNILTYLEEHERLIRSKKRIDENGQPTSEGNPIFVFKGIRLKKKYRK